MVKVLLKKVGIEVKFDKFLIVEGIKDEKIIILVIGGSLKGLGVVGIKVEDEFVRVEKLIKVVKIKKIKIIGMYIGGEVRRGELFDKFVKVVVLYCDYLIVVDEGNKDGIFIKMFFEKKIFIDIILKIINVVDFLKKVFE